MSDPARLLVDHLDIWTSAVERKSGAGRGNGNKLSLYGIENLRGLILDLGVRGKLVPQDPADEPASALLESLTTQLRDPAKHRLISRYAGMHKHSQTHHPFKVPDSWEWVEVAKLGHNWGQAVPELDFTYIDVGAIDQKAGRIVEPQVLQAGEAPSRARKIVKRGTVIYSTVRPYLMNIAIIDEDFEPKPIASTAFAVVHPFDGVDANFVYRVFRSPYMVRYVENCQTGIAYPAINDKQFYNAPFPLPPLAEQKRIAAKIDELMALCDVLEADTREAMAAHETLVRELLATLVNSQDTDDLAANWSRIATHFDTLFTTEASIDQLKQTILVLAVMGKLAQRDPDDQPAPQLLQHWKEAKDRAYDQSKDRRIRPAPDPEGCSLEVPAHWAAQSFENMFLFIDYRGRTPPKTETGIPLITAKNIRMGYLDREPREFVSESTFESWMVRGFPKSGDLFFTPEAPLGNICVNDIDEPFAIAQRLICLQPYGEVNTKFYMFMIMSKAIQRVLDDNATGMTARGIKAAKLKPIPLPVPPEAEQKRIVAKIDELMAICDALASSISVASGIEKKLAEVIATNAAA